MPLLHRKSLLAVAAVTDVALNGPVSGKALAKHHHLRPRHLEPVLQALVREGILGTVNDESEKPVSGSALVDVVDPALAKAENAFSNTLSRITIEDLTRSAALRARKGSNFG
jgi:DNA-binding IscR family transcriptional regulator